MAQEDLARAYLPAIYAYLRAVMGLNAHDADDLASMVAVELPRLAGELSRKERTPDASFRNFLRRCAKNMVLNWFEKRDALKRGGGAEHHSMSEVEEPQPESDVWKNAELQFDREWAVSVVTTAKDHLRAEYHGSDKDDDHDEYDAYIPWLIPIPELPPHHAVLAARFGISEDTSRQRLKRLRDAFRAHIRAAVLATLNDPTELEAELHHLVRVWSAAENS